MTMFSSCMNRRKYSQNNDVWQAISSARVGCGKRSAPHRSSTFSEFNSMRGIPSTAPAEEDTNPVAHVPENLDAATQPHSELILPHYFSSSGAVRSAHHLLRACCTCFRECLLKRLALAELRVEHYLMGRGERQSGH